MIRLVKFVSIPVENQQRALEFYTNQLGFNVLTDQPFSAEQRWIELQIPGAETSVVLFRMDDGIKPGSTMNIAFATDDVEGTYRELSEKGVQFLQPPTRQEWGTFAMFLDSEGNRFVLSSRR